MPSDLGSQFTSDLFEYVNKILKTQHRTTTPYHPQTNGVIEKFHYSLVNSIKYVCSTRENDWDEFINMSLFVFRTTKNKTLEMTPFEAMHGFKAGLPIDLALDIPRKCENVGDWIKDLRKIRKGIVKTVEISHQKMKDKSNDKLKINFKKDDAVFVKNEVIERKKIRKVVEDPEAVKGKTKKFTNKYTGPYIVREQTSSNNYTLRHALTGKIKKTHISKMKKGYLNKDDLKDYIEAVKNFEKEEEANKKLSNIKRTKAKRKKVKMKVMEKIMK